MKTKDEIIRSRICTFYCWLFSFVYVFAMIFAGLLFGRCIAGAILIAKSLWG